MCIPLNCSVFRAAAVALLRKIPLPAPIARATRRSSKSKPAPEPKRAPAASSTSSLDKHIASFAEREAPPAYTPWPRAPRSSLSSSSPSGPGPLIPAEDLPPLPLQLSADFITGALPSTISCWPSSSAATTSCSSGSGSSFSSSDDEDGLPPMTVVAVQRPGIGGSRFVECFDFGDDDAVDATPFPYIGPVF